MSSLMEIELVALSVIGGASGGKTLAEIEEAFGQPMGPVVAELHREQFLERFEGGVFCVTWRGRARLQRAVNSSQASS